MIKNKSIKSIIKKKRLNRYTRFNNKTVKKNTIVNRYFNDSLALKLWSFLRINKKRKLSLFVRIAQNNIFCTLQNVKTRKVIKSCSSGQLRTTKRSLKFNLRIILTKFLKSFKRSTAQI